MQALGGWLRAPSAPLIREPPQTLPPDVNLDEREVSQLAVADLDTVVRTEYMNVNGTFVNGIELPTLAVDEEQLLRLRGRTLADST